MRLSVRLNCFLTCGVALVSLSLALFQAQVQRHGLRRELGRRAQVVAESLERSTAPLLLAGAADRLQNVVDRFVNHQHLAAAAVYDTAGKELVVTPGAQPLLAAAFGSAAPKPRPGDETSRFFSFGRRSICVVTLPVAEDTMPLGVAAVFHDASYIDAQQASFWRRALAGVLAQTVLIVCLTLLILRWSLRRPLARLTGWLSELRRGKTSAEPDLPEEAAFQPLKREAARLANTLSAARAAAVEEARLRDAAESRWTEERLRIFIQTRVAARRLFVISNREPYEHVHRGNAIECSVPASGLVTALEPILRASDGTWIAQASGDADRETVDRDDHVRVPPEHPQYTLRRIWLAPEEEQGFYFGFANEGLWPLCHIAHTRPIFRAQDWEQYRVVNRRFAEALLDEIEQEEHPVVLVQDYHFALLPRMIKEQRPDARVAIFWHIPWPNPEAFGICPWQAELLDGLLGADLIGFHVQAHCNNFLETVDRTFEARIDRDRFAVKRRGHFTFVRPFPISVLFSEDSAEAGSFENLYIERAGLLRALGVEAPMLGVGVDRVDYTKGILERFRALETFFEKYPIYRGQFTFVQIGAPSRTHIRTYQNLMEEVTLEAERINRRFREGSWKPLVFLPKHHSHSEILPYYRCADLCMVTSLHDGMNLVAKEYIASRADGQGMLILSRFTGASHELTDALQVNPYDIEGMADAIHRALEMSPEERAARMARMRTYVREHNIYRWAATLIAELAAIRLAPGESEPALIREPAVAARS
ncbi:MAG: trehalose-6-phosphate synthase [Bryobacteraceae bacterium]|jgi:trehalose 6-phosphate synthase